MKKVFTSESVSPGHPDKVADQISDAILDAYLQQDKDAHVACETLVTTGQVILAGEVKSSAIVDVNKIVREEIFKIGYTKKELMFDDTCGIINIMHSQSPDICRGVENDDEKKQGAGDQGFMFGYATNENEAYIPNEQYIARLIIQELNEEREAYEKGEYNRMFYLRPDGKCQVTIEYDDYNNSKKIDTIVLSCQHDEFASDVAMHETIENDVRKYILPQVISKSGNLSRLFFDYNLYVNPTGKFVIGGPHGDTGITGRKIIADTYGGRIPHGGGAFSGKDPSKVDRAGAYMARYIAKNIVKEGYADDVLIQLGYIIGMAEPCSINIKTSTNHAPIEEIEKIVNSYDLTPYGIEQVLHLKQPIYEPTAKLGHFGWKSYIDDKGIEYFTWEKTKVV